MGVSLLMASMWRSCMMTVQMPSCMAMATTYRHVVFQVLPAMVEVLSGDAAGESATPTCVLAEAVQVWWKTEIVPDCMVPAWADPISRHSDIPPCSHREILQRRLVSFLQEELGVNIKGTTMRKT